jgi:multiple sugar transport system permease protein
MIKKAVLYFLVALLMAFTLLPFVWMISTSIKPASEVYSYPPRLVPSQPTMKGYAAVLAPTESGELDFFLWVKNSFLVSALTTLFAMFVAVLGGYALSRFSFFGKMSLGYVILISQVLPGSVIIIPLYILMGKLNLLNTLLGLALAYVAFTVPFCTWMIKGFFDSIPKSIDESALVEGCTTFQAFRKVVLPLTIPGIVATSVFSFVSGWNEYLFASVFMKSYGKWTLSVGLASFQGQYSTNWANIMAGSVLIALPIVLLFLFLQKFLVSGMTAGAVKQ